MADAAASRPYASSIFLNDRTAPDEMPLLRFEALTRSFVGLCSGMAKESRRVTTHLKRLDLPGLIDAMTPATFRRRVAAPLIVADGGPRTGQTRR